MFERWRSTVRTLSTRRAAISSLLRPSATRREDLLLAARSGPTPAAAPGGRRRGRRRGTPRPRSRNSRHAGSSASRMWLWPSSGRNRAPGISAGDAAAPPRTSTTASSRACGDEGRASAPAPRGRSRRARRAPARSRAAVSGEADVRWISSNHAICSGVPSGRNSVVNSRRKAEFERPQPTRIASTRTSASSRCDRVAAGAPARVAAVDDEVADALGVADGVGDRQRRALRDAEQREPVDARRRRRPPRGPPPTGRA